MMEETLKAGLIREIVELQKQAGRNMRSHAPDALLSLNLTMAQLKCLAYINFEGVVNFKMLGAALGVTPPNLTGIVDRMVEQKLIIREENPDNRRMQMLKLTPRGEAIINELQESGNAHMKAILSIMNIDDLSALARGMHALVKAAEIHNQSKQ
jgi:DNA-binding MarR family transcriptional regulator